MRAHLDGAIEDINVPVPRLLSVRDAARILGLERWRLYEILKRGEGPDYLRVGRTIRIPQNALTQWIRAGVQAQRRPAGMAEPWAQSAVVVGSTVPGREGAGQAPGRHADDAKGGECN